MQQNMDCIRHILLTVEALQEVNRKDVLLPLVIDDLQEYLSDFQYQRSDLYYNSKQLYYAGFLSCQILALEHQQKIIIHDITALGHDFLHNVRCPKRWEQTKKICASAGSFSLSILAQVAEQLILKQTQKYLSRLEEEQTGVFS